MRHVDGAGTSALVGNGDGTFQTMTDVATGGATVFTAAADVSGDSKLDLIAVGGNMVSVLLGNGSGGFAAKTSYPSGTTRFRSPWPT